MAKERFEERRFTGNFNVACKYDDGTTRFWNESKLETVKRIVSIVQRYQKLGYNLSLRQLHYQMVSRNWIVNHTTAYKKLGTILDDCRYAGLIDWNAIVDRGRIPYLQYYVRNISHALQDTIDQYKLDRMKGQQYVIEVWTEKDALSEILRTSTEKYHVQLIVNKGYTSSSAAYSAYKRLLKAVEDNKKFKIFYIGDHDPSGLDMVRDIRERLTFFVSFGNNIKHSDEFQAWYSSEFLDDDRLFLDSLDVEKQNKFDAMWNEISDSKHADLGKQFMSEKVIAFMEATEMFSIKPICLNMQQIKQYDLPENPTKMTDTRSSGYIKKFGKKCWEVDALEPQVLTGIVDNNIEDSIDMDLYEEILEKEKEDIIKLTKEVDKFKNEDDDDSI